MPNYKQRLQELPPIEFPRLQRIIKISQSIYHKLPQTVQERIKRPDVEQIFLRTFDTYYAYDILLKKQTEESITNIVEVFLSCKSKNCQLKDPDCKQKHKIAKRTL